MSGSGKADTDSIGVVGILFQESDPRIVLDLLPDGPAAKAGIRVGDTILRIDGQHIEPMSSSDLTSIEEFTDMMRGLPGTDVTLTIKRSDATESKEFTLTRIPFTLYDR
jgi:carboxyl-terminal processing protease